MYNKKLCMSISKSYGMSLPEQIRLFKKTGFEGFFVLWQKGMDEEIKECYEVAKEENMIFQSIHAPWGYCQDMWDENEKEDARKGVEELKHCLELCRMYDVPVLVSHVFVGFDVEYKPTEFGLINNRLISCEAECIEWSDFCDLVGNKGHAFLTADFHSGKRNKSNFKSQQIFALDFDGTASYSKVSRLRKDMVFP